MSALAGLVAALAVAVPQTGNGWMDPVEPFTIAEDLHYVGTVDLAAYLLTSDEGHILIDAPLEENVELVLANVRTLGFDPTDIRVQLASHAHFDHVGGLAAMLEATGAELALSSADAAYVEQGRDFGLSTAGYRPARAARILDHLDTVTVGDLTLTAHLTPGHTPGCTTWSGEARIEGSTYTWVSVCSLSVLPGYRLTGPDATYPGQGRDYCASVAHLRSLEPDVFLASHGSFFGLEEKLAALRAGDARAFVERERYAEYLDRAEAAIERQLAAEGHQGGCEALLAAGAGGRRP
ncbi:MAG TPA: subclass B3 metallo-beta-lactamase [Longimicrobiales bacterium]|nr:subclass B3 metallo-beta-lactamase [Longimicrobiales bacterium]